MKDLGFLYGMICHRGLYGDLPENSLVAFKNAIDNGLALEFDVHVIKDGTIVVFHDDNLYRMCGVRKRLKDCSYNDICNLKLRGTRYGIPTLEEVLKLIDGKVPIIIELKYDRFVGILERKVCKLLDDYNGVFCVKSFNPLSVLWFRVFKSDYKRGFLIGDRNSNIKERIIKSKFFIWMCNPDFISCNYKLYNDERILRFKCKKPVIAWTINSDKLFIKYKDKFDGIIFENLKKYR